MTAFPRHPALPALPWAAPIARAVAPRRARLPALLAFALMLCSAASPGGEARAATAQGVPLSPQRQAKLESAAKNPSLAPWQRDLMQKLARGPAHRSWPANAARQVRPSLAGPSNDGTWIPITDPTAGEYHTAIYDPVRDRMVIFGGFDGTAYLNNTWALSLSGIPTWSELLPTGSLPAPRYAASAVYDPVRDRMVIFGGVSWTGSYLNDVWALPLSGTLAWSQLSPTGTPPLARYLTAAIYDSLRDRLLLCGGYSAAGYVNDVWALPLSALAWSQVSPTGTPPDPTHVGKAAYDPVRDRMLFFGGVRGFYSSDTWALSLSGSPAWSLLPVTGTLPAPRYDATVTYDPVRDQMLIFGGVHGPDLNDAWALSLSGTPAWSQLSPTGTPPSARDLDTAIYDPVRDRLLIYGGTDGSYLNDTWALSLPGTPAWSQLLPAGARPSTRDECALIYDPVRDRMLVFGGEHGLGNGLNDAWALSLSGTPTWSELFPAGTPPAPRYFAAPVYDPVRDRMLIFGGSGAGSHLNLLNDTWALSLSGTPTWSELFPSGTLPSARTEHSAIYDPVRDRLVVFGGANGSVALNDAWALSLAGASAWTHLSPTGTLPPPRAWHSAVYDPVRDRMLIFGGTGSTNLNDTWALSFAGTSTWSQILPTGTPPSARFAHAAIYDPVRDRMVVFAGEAGIFAQNDTWALSLSGAPAWLQLQPAATVPTTRTSVGAAYDPVRDRMIVFGGTNDGGADLNDTSALTWGTPVMHPPLPPGLGILSVFPSTAGDSGSVSLEVVGQAFVPGSTVSLAQAGRSNIAAQSVVVDASGRFLVAQFDLTGEAHAAWDLVVVNPDATSATSPQAVTIGSATPPDVSAEIIGSDWYATIASVSPVRIYAIALTNAGNVNTTGDLLVVVPNDVSASLSATNPPLSLAPVQQYPIHQGLALRMPNCTLPGGGRSRGAVLRLVLPSSATDTLSIHADWIPRP